MKQIDRNWKDHEFAEYRTFVGEFANESDRAAVILGAAKLDILLYQILQKFLVPVANGSDELLDGDSPLGTFSSRINSCYRLGLISREMARSLHLVRRIRNSFAHEFSGISLDSGAHRDRIKELCAPFRIHKKFDEFIDTFFDGKQSIASDFRAVVVIMCLRLDGTFDCLSPMTDQSQDLVPPLWNEAPTTPASEPA